MQETFDLLNDKTFVRRRIRVLGATGAAKAHVGDIDELLSLIETSEAAPCPLQPCYFAKWDILADISDSQYVMGFPACIFDHFRLIFRIPCHCLMYERDYPIFQKSFFPKIRIPVQLLFLSFYV